jgi:hypothetical protein
MKMAKILSYLEVAELTVDMARKLHMRVPSADELLKNMNRHNSLPQQFRDTGSQLWVDKYYLAYSRWDDPDVHYVYLTAEHIEEEYISYKEARQARKTLDKLPVAIKKQFAEAELQMRATENNYAIFKIV